MHIVVVFFLLSAAANCIDCKSIVNVNRMLSNKEVLSTKKLLFNLCGGASKKKGKGRKVQKGDAEVKSGADKNEKEAKKIPKKEKRTVSRKETVVKKKEIRLADFIEEPTEEGFEENDDTSFIQTKEASSPLKIFSSIVEIFQKTPPITRYFLLASGIITTLSSLFNKNQWPSFLNFEWSPFLFRFQWWRIVTAFLYFGQLDIFYPLTMQFVWQHMGQLERLSSKSPEDFFVMTIFGATALILLYPLLGISMKMVGHNLATFYVYIWARTFEGSDVNFMDFFTLKAEMMPWFFCLQSFLLEQEIPVADLIGIVVGHIYYYLRNKNILTVPSAVQEWFRTPAMRQAYMKFYDTME